MSVIKILEDYAKRCSEEPRNFEEIVRLNRISRNNFTKIQPISCEKDVIFIDGGQNKIYSTNRHSLYLTRIALSHYRKKEKILGYKNTYIVFVKDNEMEEFEVNVTRLEENKEFPLKCESLSQLTMKYYEVGKTDEELQTDIVATIVRKILEWIALSNIANKYHGSIIVKDGALQAGTSKELKFASDALDIVRKNKVKLIGISKRSSIYISGKYSVTSVLMHFSKKENIDFPWIYYSSNLDPQDDMKFGNTSYCKFHYLSDYAFRTDFFNMDFVEFVEIAGILSYHSNDPLFYGYPYGLIDVDREARVREDEVKRYREIFSFFLENYGKCEWNSFNADVKLKEVA